MRTVRFGGKIFQYSGVKASQTPPPRNTETNKAALPKKVNSSGTRKSWVANLFSTWGNKK